MENKIWDGPPADLGAIIVRGAWRLVNTNSMIILNFRLADVSQGGDPAFMAYHHLRAYFPIQRDQILEYVEIDFSFDPTSSASITSQERKLQKVLLSVLKYVFNSSIFIILILTHMKIQLQTHHCVSTNPF